MPENNEDMEQGDSLVTLPEETTDEQELFAPVPLPAPVPAPVFEPEPEQSSKWSWVGSTDRPEAQEEDDGISDLFRVTAEDVGASDEDLNDLTDVDLEKDILDADEDGSLDDLVVVTEADIMGDDDFGQRPSKPSSRQPRTRRGSRYQPPTSMGRSG